MRRSTVCTTTLNRGSLPLRIRKIAPLADYRLAVAVRTQQNSDESNRIVSSLRKYQNENCCCPSVNVDSRPPARHKLQIRAS